MCNFIFSLYEVQNIPCVLYLKVIYGSVIVDMVH